MGALHSRALNATFPGQNTSSVPFFINQYESTVNLGPLTTPFTYPEECATPSTYFSGYSSSVTFIVWGAQCKVLADFDVVPTQCYPPYLAEAYSSAASSHELVYSPGIACPNGWTVNDFSRSTEGVRTRSWDAALRSLRYDEALAVCCPSFYSNVAGKYCVSTAQTPVITLATFDSNCSPTTTSAYANSGVVTALAINLMVPSGATVLGYQPTELPNKSSSGGITAAKLAIAITIPIVAICAALIGCILIRRHRRKNLPTRPSPVAPKQQNHRYPTETEVGNTEKVELDGKSGVITEIATEHGVPELSPLTERDPRQVSDTQHTPASHSQYTNPVELDNGTAELPGEPRIRQSTDTTKPASPSNGSVSEVCSNNQYPSPVTPASPPSTSKDSPGLAELKMKREKMERELRANKLAELRTQRERIEQELLENQMQINVAEKTSP